MTEINKIKIGTRGSKLALMQAELVQKLLLDSTPELETEIVVIKTTGDKILDRNLNEIGGKGLFIKEIEERLLDGTIDIAVHSCKDLPAFLPDELEISCILEREDARDAFLSAKYNRISELKKAAIVGTSSPRRASQVLNLRPDVQIVPFRGNIHTRMEKLKKNEVDATFLAVAGLKRCEIDENSYNPINMDEMLPAVAQGAIGVEINKNRLDLAELLAPLNHEETEIRINAERAFLKEFEGSCRTPIAAHAIINGDEISINFRITRPDGSEAHNTSRKGDKNDGVKLGKDAALELLTKAGEGFFE